MTQPANLLMEFVLSLLVPFLTTGSLTDAALARRAAEETIAAYRTAGQDQLVTAARLVAFALTALDNLRLSMPPDLSLSMKLKLRGNASALNRATQHATAELDRQRHAVPPPQPEPLQDQAEILAALAAAKAVVQQAVAARNSEIAAAHANPAPIAAAPQASRPNPPPTSPSPTNPSPTSRPPATNRDSDLAWAAGMTRVAAKFSAELPNLSPQEQQLHLMRIKVLTQVSDELGRGDPPSLKSRLFGTTTLGN